MTDEERKSRKREYNAAHREERKRYNFTATPWGASDSGNHGGNRTDARRRAQGVSRTGGVFS